MSNRAAQASALLLLLAGCLGPGEQAPTATLPEAIRLELLVEGLGSPTYVEEAPDGSGDLWVLEQEGLVRRIVLRDGVARLEAPLLDLRDVVGLGAEQGLLGLAFDPGFSENGHFYLDYTDEAGDTVVERHTRNDGRVGGALRILHIAQPRANHNGGMLAFGPDGYLYVGMGDGGGQGDPGNRAQDPHDLLGKMLRIDVNSLAVDSTLRPLPYAIPPDNPFSDGKSGAPEVWAYGLRNPWRFSFDRGTGDLWIGDVGGNEREEVILEPAETPGGRNYGWSAWEGTHRANADRDAPGHVPPVAEYSHDLEGVCAVTGGYVYRGQAIPSLRGVYLYADYCTGDVWALRQAGGTWTPGVVLETGLSVASFGQDLDGELYLVDHGGAVHAIVA